MYTVHTNKCMIVANPVCKPYLICTKHCVDCDRHKAVHEPAARRFVLSHNWNAPQVQMRHNFKRVTTANVRLDPSRMKTLSRHFKMCHNFKVRSRSYEDIGPALTLNLNLPDCWSDQLMEKSRHSLTLRHALRFTDRSCALAKQRNIHGLKHCTSRVMVCVLLCSDDKV